MSVRTQKTLAIVALASAMMAALSGPAAVWCLVPLPARTVALLFVSRFRKARPSELLVRSGRVLSMVAGLAFTASMLVEIKFVASPSVVWHFGAARISRTAFRTRSPQFPSAPEVSFRWRPRLIPLGGTYVGMGNLRGGSSREESRATWPLVTSTLLPTLVLRRLRRERVPPGTCPSCGYNLTGNVSGRCPECARPLTPDRATHLE